MNHKQKIDEARRCFLTDVRVEKRADGEPESRTITGYAVKFGERSVPIWGSFIEVINRGAFDKADMSDVIMNYGHDDNQILARSKSGTLSINVDEIGVRFSFDAPNTTLGNDMLEMVSRGDVNQCSFAFTVSEERWTWRTEENDLDYDLREVDSVSKVYDFALVVHPAYQSTEAHVRAYQEFRSEQTAQSDPEPEKKTEYQPTVEDERIRMRARHIQMKTNL